MNQEPIQNAFGEDPSFNFASAIELCDSLEVLARMVRRTVDSDGPLRLWVMTLDDRGPPMRKTADIMALT